MCSALREHKDRERSLHSYRKDNTHAATTTLHDQCGFAALRNRKPSLPGGLAMKVHEDMTTALQHILHCWQRGYTSSVSFEISVDRVDIKKLELADDYGTMLPPWKRQDRKEAGQPTAVANCVRIIGNPAKRLVILMATPLVAQAHPSSAWAREKWRERLLEVDCYVMVREPRPRGDYAWTWRLQESVYRRLSGELTATVKRGDPGAVAAVCQKWLKVFSLTGGVRRQLRRLFQSARKLWNASRPTPWPGPDPEHLPMQIGFRGQPIEAKQLAEN